jgi:hypothetical protein
MFFELISIVFSGGKGQTWRDDTLDRRVIRQVQEERDAV